ncbi:MAG: PEP-CTERM sorting domain-containing protein [Akkermansiaceae bacterium]|nr:PEP-CTERM sorting domain-containing protein [Akkermansiaceae bacterium]
MKKTLIALACLSSCALAGTYTYTADSFSSTGAGNNASSLTLTETLTCDGTVNWTISGTFTIGSTASNEWGVALLASTTDPFADTYSGGFQFYLANGTSQSATNKDKFQVKLNNTNKNTYALTQSDITSGDTVSYTLAYAADTSTLTVTLSFTDAETSEVTTQTASTTMGSDASISALSTSAAGLEGWTLGDITVTVTSAVPEPATATLGLLALGALALRRRRA